MIYGTLSKTSTFKKITEVLATSDVVLIFDQKGMTCQGMDSSHVSMTFLNLDNRDFQEYTCNTQHRIPLNVLNLSKVIKCAGNDDAMIIRYVDGEDFITLMFKNAERVLQFSLNLVVIEQDEVEIPDMQYMENITMKATTFKATVGDLIQVGEICTVKCANDSVSFVTKGDIGEAKIVLKNCCETEISINFALRYLNIFAKAASLCDTTTMSISPELPLRLVFTISEFSQIVFFLAPQMEE